MNRTEVHFLGGPHSGEVRTVEGEPSGQQLNFAVGAQLRGLEVYEVRQAAEADGSWVADHVGTQAAGPGGFTRRADDPAPGVTEAGPK